MTNVLLHIATAVLLFIVLSQATRAFWPSAFVAAVFAVHPLHVESVAWITERKDVLSGFLFMLTIWAYLRYVRQPSSLSRYLAVLLLFALALWSKLMVATLPLVLLLLDYWPLGRFSRKAVMPGARRQLASPGTALLWEKVPLIVLVCGAVAGTLLLRPEDRVATDRPGLSQAGAAALTPLIYLRQTVYPKGLAVCYSPGRLSPTWEIVCGLSFLAAVSVAAIALRRRRPCFLVGLYRHKPCRNRETVVSG